MKRVLIILPKTNILVKGDGKVKVSLQIGSDPTFCSPTYGIGLCLPFISRVILMSDSE